MKDKTLTKGMIRKALEVMNDLPDVPLIIVRRNGLNYTLTPKGKLRRLKPVNLEVLK